MNKTLLVLGGSVLVAVFLFWLLMEPDRRIGSGDSGGNRPLMLYCAASNRGPMELIRADYEKEFGRSIEIQYGASQTLLSSMEVSGVGDLFLPADSSYIDMAAEKNLIRETIPLARMEAVIAVRKGNPKSIIVFQDLLKPDVKVSQANPDAAAIGKVTRETLSKIKLWERLEKATVGFRTTISDAANDVVIGAADAAIVFDAVLSTYPDLEAVRIPELEPAASNINLSVCASCEDSQSALHFARYVAARDRGQKHYAESGFQVETGDVWSDTPELNIYAGSMLRPAIEDAITEFEKREGVNVTTVYNGCGILVAQMKAGTHPDVYFACDKEFMKQVPDLFPESVDVSQNELVILVQKGNPHKIASLRDLSAPGIRVGIGHEKQCAMGWLTQNTLKEGGVQKEVMSNVTVESATGDFLVNQLSAGSLDAAVVYLSNAAGAGDRLDAIRIEGLACSIAIQPFAIGVESPNRQTASRLFTLITNAETQETFLAEGFQWRLNASPTSHD